MNLSKSSATTATTSSPRRSRSAASLAIVVAATVMAASAAQDPASRPKSRLAGEKSPYLRQHAHNPVDWHPWGDAAFEKARRENKPVFLSIGYASCHWCHVMEKESFENQGVAAVLNESYVAVKVDREERPDVDRVYMAATVAMIGRGGWPLSVFLTPERLPFYAGTYFPLEDQPNQTGFKTVIASIRDAWRERRSTLEDAASRIARVLANDQLSTADLEAKARDLESRPAASAEVAAIREIIARKKGPPPKNLLARAVEQIILAEDKEYGGHGEDVKFPAPAAALALLRSYARGSAPAALDAVRRQCDAMARGGIRDHLAGGFHRYATDRRWLVPHFEKMLYDQALLARVYLELFQATGDARYEAVCRETLDFAIAHMAAPEGGFIAALDATVGGVEGATYLWTRGEIEAVLDDDERAAFLAWSGFDVAGPSDRMTIAERGRPIDEASRIRVDSARAKLLAARARRPQPAVVGHVIAGWNGWMVSALARAGMVLNAPRYVEVAARTMAYLETKLLARDGLYARRAIDGDVRHPADLSDHAALIEAMLDLHEATFERTWLERASILAGAVEARFGAPDGSFRDSVATDLIFAVRELSDGATISGIGQMNLALARLARVTGDPLRLARARSAVDAVFPDVAGSASDHAYGAIAWDLVHDRAPRVAFQGPVEIALIMRAPLLLAYKPFVSMTWDPSPSPRVLAVVWVDGEPSAPARDAAALIGLLDAATSRPAPR